MNRPVLALAALCSLSLQGCLPLFFLDDGDDGEWVHPVTDAGTPDGGSPQASWDAGKARPDAGSVAPSHDAGQYAVDAGPMVTVTGQVLRADGSAQGQAVFQRPTDLGDVVLGFMTLGLSCLAGECSDKQALLDLDGAGRFAVAVAESETKGNFFGLEYLRTFTLTAAAPAPAVGIAPAFFEAEFTVSAPGTALPTLTLWEPQLSVSTSGATTFVEPSTAAPGVMDALVLDASGNRVWEAEGAKSFDTRVLEDRNDLWIGMRSRVSPDGDLFRVTYNAAPVAVQSPRQIPVTRGAACKLGTKSYSAGKCPFTDGELVKSPTSDEDYPNGVVDLGQTRSLSFILLRQTFPGWTSLESSVDGQTWTKVGEDRDGYSIEVRAQPAISARYLRVPDGTDLAELSAW